MTLNSVRQPSPHGNAGSRVVIIVPDFLPTLGGTSRQAANHATQLVANGHDVTVVTQRLDASWPRQEFRDGYEIVRLGSKRRDAVAMKLLVIKVWWWLLRARSSIAIVQVLMYPDFAISAAASGLGAVTVHTWAGLGDATDSLHRSAAAFSDRLLATVRHRALRRVGHVALTPAIVQELMNVGINRNVSVIPTPVDTDIFTVPTEAQRATARNHFALPPGAIVFVHVGHLRALKRVDATINALHLVRGHGIDARLLIVGDSRPELDDVSLQLTEQVARLGLNDTVTFVGGLDDVREVLHAANALVLASDREGLSNALLEALACGVVCIAPVTAGGDQVLHDFCGIVPASNDPDALADAMAQIADPVIASRLQSGTRATAMHYGLEEVTRQYLKLYDLRRAHHIG